MKLFCIPHAGGSSVSYKIWKNYLDKNIDFIPLDFPGHMPRSREPLCENIDEVILDLAQSVKNNLDNHEIYTIYGHSMGALLLYFLYFHLLNNGYEPPIHLFFSSRWPPYHYNAKGNYNLDNSEECKTRLIQMGGLKNEILSNKQLFDYYMAILLADFRIIQSVKLSNPQKINSEITVLWSDNEPDIVDEDIYKWKLSAGARIAFVKMKGTHFFPIEDPFKTAEVINNFLKKYI